ncbi:hypothetical protein BH11BAC2_BH11BAC2_01950 [soil metagenome]
MLINKPIRSLALIAICIIGTTYYSTAQSSTDLSNLSGNFEINAQYYRPDSAIETVDVPEKLLSNGFFNLNYTYGKFAAGIRYESYLNPQLGFDPAYKGSGIPFRFASFTSDNLKVTVGNFYEQFGNGLILRIYEERALGIDNSLDGIRVAYEPIKGIMLKGFVAKERKFFEYPDPVVRGIDGDFQLNDFVKGFEDSKLRLGVGGSFVSKYQVDDSPSRILPENVGAWASRVNLNYGNFALNSEFAYKYNDPSYDNDFIYKNGESFYTSITYTKKGTGARLNLKRVDNMSYRADRNASFNVQTINFIPAINKQLTYRLSTLYPFTTQLLGEMGIGGEFYKTWKPSTKMGGKHGTTISISGSLVNDIKRDSIDNDTLGYATDFFTIGHKKFYNEFVLEVTKKVSPKSKFIFTYIYQFYNKKVFEGYPGLITSHIGVVDYTYKITKAKSIRFELQHLLTEQDRKNWAMLLAEYSISPKWSFAVFDEWNYGNDDPDKRFHYYNASMAFTEGPTRISIAYARQRAGLLCVGGVCRLVPASNGVNLTITSRF